MSQQQTVLRVQTNIPSTKVEGTFAFEFLDLYDDVPIKINKSVAELQDISKKNSDYSIGLTLPGSKKNNRFFENFFNVDSVSLYFDASRRVECDVLLDDESFFKGYMRLNKVGVLNSKVEYSVTLYSEVGNLFGLIGNNLMKDLNYGDDEFHFNHTFNLSNVSSNFNYTNFQLDSEYPYPYFYPVVHNGYNYSGDTVIFSGNSDQTRFYSSTNNTAGLLSGYTTQAAAFSAGNLQFHINSPGQGLINNQLKPALNIWSLIKLMFKTYGYTIKSDFFNTPWMKSLYMYGFYSSESTKFSYKINNIQELPLSGVKVVFLEQPSRTINVIVVAGDSGIPCYCLSDITFTLRFVIGSPISGTITAGSSGFTQNVGPTFTSGTASVPTSTTLKYFPLAIGDETPYTDGDFVNFSLAMDQDIKQIDILSSIAKKFNLIFVPDPNVRNQIIIEPFDFYIGSGQIHDWTPKLSYDKGFTVEPALNYIESSLYLSDLEDGDEGNKEFKTRNNRIYGRNLVYNPTDFKSQEKKIETIFGPELIRKWDKDGVNNIGLPLGINYAASSQESTTGTTSRVSWVYKGVKTKPKLFFWLGGFNPFLDTVGEVYNVAPFSTYSVYVSNSNATAYSQTDKVPVISHTMPMGLADENKINNDSLSILFNSELPVNIGVQTYNVYTENDAYNTFYRNRITNLYDKNTRFLTGNFDLDYSDIKNLFTEDIIKIQEQYFIVNKISEFNLTSNDLTKVELVQYNTNTQTYPTRYFQYYYCDRPSTIYKFKTDFTNPNLLDTNFGWSVYYDNQVGSLTGSTTGFTSTIKNIQTGSPSVVYVPYTMYEVSASTYNSSGIDWTADSLMQYVYDTPGGPFEFNMPSYWVNSGSTRTGVNVFESCAQFTSVRNTYGIFTGSSTYHGNLPTPTTTPAPSPTPSATPNSFIGTRGSLLVTFDELTDGLDGMGIEIQINGNTVYLTERDTLTEQYVGQLFRGNNFTIFATNVPTGQTRYINIIRRDYTTDEINGDRGIRETNIFCSTLASFRNTTVPNLPSNIYNFEYIIRVGTAATYICPPTPTPSPTPTATPIGPTPSPTMTGTPPPTPTMTGTVTPTPTATNPFAPPNPINTDGMILYYDFQNSTSYPGTGRTANNLITGSILSGRTLQFNTTPVFSTVNYGEITYNGINARSTVNMIGVSGDFGDVSLGGWHKCSTDVYGTLFSRGGGFPEAPGWSMNIAKNRSGQIEFELITSRDRRNDIKTSRYFITSYQNLVVGQWYYIMGVWDTGNNLRLYINGVLQVMRKISDIALFGGPNYNQAALIESSGAGSYMSGSFGDLEVYAVELNTTRVVENFNAKTGSYGTTYVTSSQIPINYQLSVDNFNTGIIEIYVDRGSGFVKEVEQPITSENPEITFSGRILINPNDVFYSVVTDEVIAIGNNSYLNVFNDTSIIQSITGSAADPINSVTSNQITGSLGASYTLQAKAGNPMFPK